MLGAHSFPCLSSYKNNFSYRRYQGFKSLIANRQYIVRPRASLRPFSFCKLCLGSVNQSGQHGGEIGNFCSYRRSIVSCRSPSANCEHVGRLIHLRVVCPSRAENRPPEPQHGCFKKFGKPLSTHGVEGQQVATMTAALFQANAVDESAPLAPL